MTLPLLDNIAAAMERRWGVDRLPLMVSPATRERFDHFKAKLDTAIQQNHPQADIDAAAAIVARGWQAMDKEATERGAFPLPPACYEVDLTAEGRGIVAIAPDDHAAHGLLLAASHERRQIEVWTLAEVGRLLRDHHMAGAAKREFAAHGYTPVEPATHAPGRRRFNSADELDDILPLDGEEAA
jgi:hypothetical protein